MYLESIKKTRTITACNWLGLETLRFWPVMHRNLSGHWRKGPKEVLIISRVDDRLTLELPNSSIGAFRSAHKGWSCVSCSDTIYHMVILPFLVYLWFWSCVDGSRREPLSSFRESEVRNCYFSSVVQWNAVHQSSTPLIASLGSEEFWLDYQRLQQTEPGWSNL